jgi:hypothetical protein
VTPAARPALRLSLRLAGAMGGGYALAAQLATLAGALLTFGGMPASEATTVALLAAYLVYAGLLLWAWWEPSLVRLWGLVVTGCLACFAATWSLS